MIQCPSICFRVSVYEFDGSISMAILIGALAGAALGGLGGLYFGGLAGGLIGGLAGGATGGLVAGALTYPGLPYGYRPYYTPGYTTPAFNNYSYPIMGSIPTMNVAPSYYPAMTPWIPSAPMLRYY